MCASGVSARDACFAFGLIPVELEAEESAIRAHLKSCDQARLAMGLLMLLCVGARSAAKVSRPPAALNFGVLAKLDIDPDQPVLIAPSCPP